MPVKQNSKNRKHQTFLLVLKICYKIYYNKKRINDLYSVYNCVFYNKMHKAFYLWCATQLCVIFVKWIMKSPRDYLISKFTCIAKKILKLERLVSFLAYY